MNQSLIPVLGPDLPLQVLNNPHCLSRGLLQYHSKKSGRFILGWKGFKQALLNPVNLELSRWEIFSSSSHQLHFAGKAVALLLIAWDVLFPPIRFCKELGQELPKSSPEGLSHFGDSQDRQESNGVTEERKTGAWGVPVAVFEACGQQC